MRIPLASAVYQYRLIDNPDAWLIMLAPGCGIEEARRVLDLQYPGRVLAVRGHQVASRGTEQSL